MKQRSLANQHRMLEVLLERFDAVDVTGMTAWEKARAVHGRTAAGLGGEALADKRLGRGVADNLAASLGAPASPPSPVATPLFDIESEAA